MKIKSTILLLLCITIFNLRASKIQLNFPDFQGKNYQLMRYWGLQGDTIRGALNLEGKVEIDLGEKDTYRGLASIKIDGMSQPLQVVINKENFELTLDSTGIKFTNSPENDYMKKQSYLLFKANYKQRTIQQLLQSYEEQSTFRSQLIKELEIQSNIIQNLNKEIANSQLYAAKLIKLKQTYDAYLEIQDDENIDEFRKQYLRTLDISSLYTTPMWRDIISYWVSIEYNKIPDHRYFVSDAINLIHETESNSIRDEFANALVDISEQYNWMDVKENLGIRIYNYKLVNEPTRNLRLLINSLGVQVGADAPNFQIDEKQSLNDFKQDKVLLFFYEDGCDHCNKEIAMLKKNYDNIVAKNVKIISITTEENDATFNFYAKEFPWSTKVNEKSNKVWETFGVYMTPTYFLLDKGKILGRYVNLKDIEELNN